MLKSSKEIALKEQRMKFKKCLNINLLRLCFLIPDFKLDIDSQMTKKFGKEFQGGTIRTEEKVVCKTFYFGGYKVLYYGLYSLVIILVSSTKKSEKARSI